MHMTICINIINIPVTNIGLIASDDCVKVEWQLAYTGLYILYGEGRDAGWVGIPPLPNASVIERQSIK